MDIKDIIDWKLQQCQQGRTDPLPESMQALVEEQPQLKQELAFIEQFYQADIAPEQPSAELDARFYQMLSQAQSAQPTVNRSGMEKPSTASGGFSSWLSWLSPNPVAQFAVFALVFVLGYSSSQLQTGPDVIPVADNQLTDLQKEVASLSSVVALSLLRQPSASERLSGIAYSTQANFNDPLLTETLLNLLAHDSSISVRLAIIDALGSAPQLNEQEDQLLAMVLEETNPMFQLELSRLLLSRGSEQTIEALLSEAQNPHFHLDVQAFLKEYRSRSAA